MNSHGSCYQELQVTCIALKSSESNKIRDEPMYCFPKQGDIPYTENTILIGSMYLHVGVSVSIFIPLHQLWVFPGANLISIARILELKLSCGCHVSFVYNNNAFMQDENFKASILSNRCTSSKCNQWDWLGRCQNVNYR